MSPVDPFHIMPGMLGSFSICPPLHRDPGFRANPLPWLGSVPGVAAAISDLVPGSVPPLISSLELSQTIALTLGLQTALVQYLGLIQG